MESVELVTDRLEKPLVDNRTYCVVRLPNDLEALLVHDPTTDEAGACMDIDVGSMSDELPGMAHALEHLVLRGTSKFPGENDFNEYIAAHSGYSNAHTYNTHTNYHLKVAALPSNGEDPTATNPSPLLGALERLSRLAIDPLIHPETVDRELQAVNSEYKMYLQDDTWRMWQLEHSTSNPKHPWNHFGVGSIKVLKEDPESRGINIRDAFAQFHSKHYSANRTKLCILGREPISLLATWAFQCFSEIPNKQLKPERWPDELPYTSKELGLQYFVKPITSYRELILGFPFLDETDLYESPPSQYLKYLLCHKSPGSIFAYIKDKGWATGIAAYVVSLCPGSPSLFRCNITLTQEGLKSYKEVAKVFFQYISLLKEKGPQERIFDEAKYIAQLRFKYMEKVAVEDFTLSIAARMQGPIPRKWLLGPECQIKFDPDLITKGIECLRPDNLRITVVAPEGTWDQTEEWYGTEYRAEPIPAEFLDELTKLASGSAKDRPDDLYLPRKNPFLPADLTLKQPRTPPPGKPLLPEVVRNDERARTWWMDSTFEVPKAFFISLWRSPLLMGSPEKLIKAYLLVQLIEDKLLDSAYEAAQAGLSYDVTFESRGLQVYVNGYNDKLADLLELIITTIKNLEIRDDRFKIIKDDAIDEYRNKGFRVPYNQAATWFWTVITKTAVGYESQAALLPSVDADVLRSFKDEVLSQFHIDCYAHGNLDREEARKLTGIIESKLNPKVLPRDDWPVIKSLALRPGFTYRYEKDLADPKNVNNSIEYYVYGGDRTDAVLRAKMRLLSQMTSKIAFDWLRTKLQLGYVVMAFARASSTAYGFSIIVQGEKSCRYMENCTAAFLKTYLKWLEKTSESDFETQKHSLIASVLEKPKNLYEHFSKIWTQIDDEYYNFELAQEYATNVEALTKDDMIEFYKHYIDPSSPHCARLVVNMKSQVKENGDASADPLAALNDTSMTAEDIKKHLQLKLKVNETELDDGVDLWCEIRAQNQAAESDEAEDNQAINIDDLKGFKSTLDALSPPDPDLSKYESQN
ncbi:a-pheromone processing metallopeptidase ste23 [Thozetella sp. PMI_491]|nr:a-pheromone processing metallopeptidase ste23 [Thozetella sp. PMI_491]